ncbi:MAG TPA: metal ABC transporter permease [Actinomycetota bacterium]|nr:metal ABC transporter permease [Actinomycetota bacterium]
MSTLVEPFDYAFFRHGLVVATLAGALCGLVGVYVVLRGMSYIGHGLSHAIFGGAVASFVTGINFYLGAGVWGLVSALLIDKVARRRTVGADAAIGVVTTASFALGLALISRFGGFTRNFEAALFGNVLGVTFADVWVVAGVAAFAAGVVFFRYRQLLFATFDPEVAEASGVRTAHADLLLALTLAATVTATMNVLGVTLIAAVLVIPAVIARLLTDSFARMLAISVVVGTLCGFFGVYLSYYLNISSGASVVLLSAAVFVVAYAVSGVRRRLASAAVPFHLS